MQSKFPIASNEISNRSYEPVLGFYDRYNGGSIKQDSFRHFAIVLNDESWNIDIDMLDSLPSDANVLITIEMWGSKYLSKVKNEVLRETIKGTYEKRLKELVSKIGSSRQNVYIRWNPEMEVTVNRYPWQRSPQAYIEAFRYVAQLVKRENSNLKIVWGPSGYPGTHSSFIPAMM